MKINEHFISIPPYVSVSWKEVAALQIVENDMIIHLKGGNNVLLPQISVEQTKLIFDFHQRYLDQESMAAPFASSPFSMGRMGSPFPFETSDLAELPIAFKIGTPDGVVSALGHNPAQAESTDLPKEILDKISSVTKSMGMAPQDSLPLGEDHCNCFFCQIMNHIHHTTFLEEEVCEEDLIFHEWDIKETSENLFSVENPLDSAEKYSVYLGHPIGCSCGNHGCEHIIAVLKS